MHDCWSEDQQSSGERSHAVHHHNRLSMSIRLWAFGGTGSKKRCQLHISQKQSVGERIHRSVKQAASMNAFTGRRFICLHPRMKRCAFRRTEDSKEEGFLFASSRPLRRLPASHEFPPTSLVDSIHTATRFFSPIISSQRPCI